MIKGPSRKTPQCPSLRVTATEEERILFKEPERDIEAIQV